MSAETPPLLPADLQVIVSELASNSDTATALSLSSSSKTLSDSAVKNLFARPFLHSRAQVQRFNTALRGSYKLKPLIKSLALEDRSLAKSASVAEWPEHEDSHEDREAWSELCTNIEKLVSQHSLRAIAISVTASKRLLDGPLDVIKNALPLDQLALTGADIYTNDLLRTFNAKQVVFYGCEHAWWSQGVTVSIMAAGSERHSKPKFSSHGPLELVLAIGAFPGRKPSSLIHALVDALFWRRKTYKLPNFQRIVLRVRCGLASIESMQTLIAKAGDLLPPDVEVVDWNATGSTQIEAEQNDWTSSTWLQHGTSDKTQLPSDEGREWCSCDSSEIKDTDDEDEMNDSALDLLHDQLRERLG